VKSRRAPDPNMNPNPNFLECFLSNSPLSPLPLFSNLLLARHVFGNHIVVVVIQADSVKVAVAPQAHAGKSMR
jgi:hypothetical protein